MTTRRPNLSSVILRFLFLRKVNVFSFPGAKLVKLRFSSLCEILLCYSAQVYAEVETRIQALRHLLLEKLLQTPSTLHDQKRYIRSFFTSLTFWQPCCLTLWPWFVIGPTNLSWSQGPVRQSSEHVLSSCLLFFVGGVCVCVCEWVSVCDIYFRKIVILIRNKWATISFNDNKWGPGQSRASPAAHWLMLVKEAAKWMTWKYNAVNKKLSSVCQVKCKKIQTLFWLI